MEDNHIDNQKDVINTLVDLRNHIAHGEYNVLTFETYESFYDDILALMEYLKTKIENNASLGSYKLNKPLIQPLPPAVVPQAVQAS